MFAPCRRPPLRDDRAPGPPSRVLGAQTRARARALLGWHSRAHCEFPPRPVPRTPSCSPRLPHEMRRAGSGRARPPSPGSLRARAPRGWWRYSSVQVVQRFPRLSIARPRAKQKRLAMAHGGTPALHCGKAIGPFSAAGLAVFAQLFRLRVQRRRSRSIRAPSAR